MYFVRHKNIFLSIAIAIVTGSIAVIAVLGLPLGIDFTGGSLTEVSYSERPGTPETELALSDALDLGAFSVRGTFDDAGRDGYIVRTRDLTESERQLVEATLLSLGTEAELIRFTSIGPVIGQELKDKAVWAIGAVALIIIIYVAYAFRGVSQIVTSRASSWVYGLITILALLHDVLVPTAVFAFLGYVMGAEADVLFVMALLAVLGYSVNDTIVVFDRVRENLLLNQEKAKQIIETHGKAKQAEAGVFLNEPFDQIVGRSVDQTIMRSVNTSVTTLLALIALYFIGGSITQTFSLMLIAGVLAGTYSSIAIANPLLAYITERLPEREVFDESNKKKPAPGLPEVVE